MSSDLQRPLTGLSVGISISPSEDLQEHYGLSAIDMSAITVELCRRFVGLGAAVVLGHQWRPSGIMEAITRFARAYQWEASWSHGPIIHNFLAWPDRAALSQKERNELQPLVRIHEAEGPPSGSEQSSKATAYSTMRKLMAEICDARICLSGKTVQGKEDYISGVLEESSLMLAQKKPVYVSAMLGGVSKFLVDRLRGRESDSELSIFGNTERSRGLLSQFDKDHYLAVRELCGLYEAEMIELFDAQNLDTIVELTARGLSRLKKQEAKEKFDTTKTRSQEILNVIHSPAAPSDSNAVENPKRSEKLTADQWVPLKAADGAEKPGDERSEEDWWITANSAFQEKDYVRALELARSASKRFPQSSWKYWNFIGLINHWTQPSDRPPDKSDGWFKAAIDAYDRAEKDPSATPEQRLLSKINRGFVYYDVYDYQSVLKEMEQIVQTLQSGGYVNPPLLDLARLMRAAARVHNGDQQGALDDLRTIEVPNNFSYLIKSGDIRKETVEQWRQLPNLNPKVWAFVNEA